MRQSERERESKERGFACLPALLKKTDRQRKKDTQTLVRLCCCTQIWQKQLRDAALSIILLVDRHAHTHRHTHQSPDSCTMGQQCRCVFLHMWLYVFVCCSCFVCSLSRQAKSIYLFSQTSSLNFRAKMTMTKSRRATCDWKPHSVKFTPFPFEWTNRIFDFRVLDPWQYIVMNLQGSKIVYRIP